MLSAVALPPAPPLPSKEFPPLPPLARAVGETELEPLRFSETLALPPRAPVVLEAVPPTPPWAATVASIGPPPGLLVVRVDEALPPWPGVAPSLLPPFPPKALWPSETDNWEEPEILSRMEESAPLPPLAKFNPAPPLPPNCEALI